MAWVIEMPRSRGVAHHAKRSHCAQQRAEPHQSALFFGRRQVREAREKRLREMQPERRSVCIFLLRHRQVARADAFWRMV